MTKELVIASIVFFIVLVCLVLYLVRKKRISVKYSLVWIIPSVILIIFTLWPGCMVAITKLLGFKTASNMVIAALIGLLLVINLSLTVIVTNQKDKIRLLIQEVSLLKENKYDE